MLHLGTIRHVRALSIKQTEELGGCGVPWPAAALRRIAAAFADLGFRDLGSVSQVQAFASQAACQVTEKYPLANGSHNIGLPFKPRSPRLTRL